MTRIPDRRTTVMIVEDDLDLSRMARDMAEACGLTPFECATGEAAHDHLPHNAGPSWKAPNRPSSPPPGGMRP